MKDLFDPKPQIVESNQTNQTGVASRATKNTVDFQLKFRGKSVSMLGLLTLAACGNDTGETLSETPVELSVGYSGAVIKGPLHGATVFLDYDGDGVVGANEPSVRTEADGSFELTGNIEGMGFVAQTDENTIDTSSGEVLDNVVLKAPSGSSVVTPTTTIIND